MNLERAKHIWSDALQEQSQEPVPRGALFPSKYLASEGGSHRHSEIAKKSIEVLKTFKDEAYGLFKHAEAARLLATHEKGDKGQKIHPRTSPGLQYDGIRTLYPTAALGSRIDSHGFAGSTSHAVQARGPYLASTMTIPTSLPLTADAPNAAVQSDDEDRSSSSGQAWKYRTTRANIAILSRQRRAVAQQPLDKTPSPNGRTDKENGHDDDKTSPGRRQPIRNELPIFRGEGFLFANHRLEDIVCGVIRNFGARVVWDSLYSYEVLEIFDNTDQLVHGFGRGTELVTPRDYCAVMSMTIDDDEQTAFVSATSALDALAPERQDGRTIRSQIDISGWILQKRKVRIVDGKLVSGHLIGERARVEDMAADDDDEYEDGDKLQGEEVNAIHISYVVQSDPRGSIPQSFLNHLSLSLPLCVASVITYINRWGFAPYLLRRGIKRHGDSVLGKPPRLYRNGVRICSEEWDHKSAHFVVIFCVYKPQATNLYTRNEVKTAENAETDDECSLIRLFPPTFEPDGFQVEVRNATDWYIVYDEPTNPGSSARSEQQPASIVIPHESLKHAVPVQVKITRKAPQVRLSAAGMKQASEPFGPQAGVALKGTSPNDKLR